MKIFLYMVRMLGFPISVSLVAFLAFVFVSLIVSIVYLGRIAITVDVVKEPVRNQAYKGMEDELYLYTDYGLPTNSVGRNTTRRKSNNISIVRKTCG